MKQLAPRPVLRLAREGWPLVISLSLVVALAVAMDWLWLAAPVLVAQLFVINFFRLPKRTPVKAESVVLAPADGRVISLGQTQDPFLLRPALKISIFMNVFNVHGNFSPVAGEVLRRWYRPGKFVNADLDKASEHNEQAALHLRTKAGDDVVVVQVAGLIARRILCYAHGGDQLAAGERYGFIRFGSRVDLYLPLTATPLLALGTKTTAVSQALAQLRGAEKPLERLSSEEPVTQAD